MADIRELKHRLFYSNINEVMNYYNDVDSLLKLIKICIEMKKWYYIDSVAWKLPRTTKFDELKVALLEEYLDKFDNSSIRTIVSCIVDDVKKEEMLEKLWDYLQQGEDFFYVIESFNSDQVKKRLFRKYKDSYDGVDFSGYLRSLKSDDLRLSEFNEFKNDYEEFRIDWIANSFASDADSVAFFEDNFDLMEKENVAYFISHLRDDVLKVNLLDKYYEYVGSGSMWFITGTVKDKNVREDLLKRYSSRMESRDLLNLLLQIGDFNERLAYFEMVSSYLNSGDIVKVLNKFTDYEMRDKLIKKYLSKFKDDDLYSLYIYTEKGLRDKFLDTYVLYMKNYALARIFLNKIDDFSADFSEALDFLKKYLEYFNPLALRHVIEEIVEYKKKFNFEEISKLLIEQGREKNCLKLVYNGIAFYDKNIFLKRFKDDFYKLFELEDLEIINELLKNNKYLFSSFVFELLDIKELKQNFYFLEKLSKYPNIANEVCHLYKLNNKKTIILIDILKYVSKQDVYLDRIFLLLIEAIKDNKYDEIIEKIDFNSIGEEFIKKFISILLKKENIYYGNHANDIELPLKRIEDFFDYDKKYDYLVDNLFIHATEIDDLKNCFFNKYFGIDIETAKKLLTFYGTSLDRISLKELDYLRKIKYVIGLNDEESIREYYEKGEKISLDDRIFIEQKIKMIFNEKISASLYSVDNVSPVSNIYYKGNRIDVYKPEGEFNLLVNSLSAYREASKITDYNSFWNDNEKVTNHGICCSFISNQNICSTAPVGDIIFGFDSFSNKAIQLMSSMDLNSTNDEFVFDSLVEPRFMLPADLINYTRHHHNELLLERIELREDKALLYQNIQPSYVVLYDIANQSKVEKSIKAAYEMGVPIVYIETEKIIERERETIKKLFDEAFSNLRVSAFEAMIVRRENNIHSFSRDFKEYNEKYFPLREIDGYIESFFELLCIHFYEDVSSYDFVKSSFERIIEVLKLEKEKRLNVVVDGEIDLDKWIDLALSNIEMISRHRLDSTPTL